LQAEPVIAAECAFGPEVAEIGAFHSPVARIAEVRAACDAWEGKSGGESMEGDNERLVHKF